MKPIAGKREEADGADYDDDHGDRKGLADAAAPEEQAQPGDGHGDGHGHQGGPRVTEEYRQEGEEDENQGVVPLHHPDEPENRGQPAHDGGIVGQLGGRDRPHRPLQPAFREGLVWTQHDTSERDTDDGDHAPQMAAHEEQVAPGEPRREEPQHGDEANKPHAPVSGPGMEGHDADEQGVHGEDREDHQVGVGPQADVAVDGEGEQQGHPQRGLRDALADEMRERKDEPLGGEGQDVHEQQGPDPADPAPDRGVGVDAPRPCVARVARPRQRDRVHGQRRGVLAVDISLERLAPRASQTRSRGIIAPRPAILDHADGQVASLGHVGHSS